MRRYLSKIVTIAFVIGFFMIAMNVDAPTGLGRLSTRVLVDQKYDDADPCSSGEGKTYYVNTSSLNVRKGPSTDYESLDSYDRCTAVKVYCERNGWGKISKTSDLYVSMNYLKDSRPILCFSTKQTTTSKITFSIANFELIPYAELDKMYSNKEGTIKFELVDVTNLANDDDELIDVSVTLNKRDVTGDFIVVDPSYNNGTAYITLVQADPKMDSGTYTVKVRIGETIKEKSFTIDEPYYDFSINQEESGKVSGDDNYTPSNIENEWNVVINPLVDATDYSVFKWKIFKDGKDVSNKFNVTKKGNQTWVIKNKTRPASSRPQAGTYKFYLYYQDDDYSTSRGTLEDFYEFNINGRYVVFHERDRVSNRYIKNPSSVAYSISINRINSNIVTYVENGKTYQKNVTDFANEFVDFDINTLTEDASGYLTFVYSAGLSVTRRTATHVTYVDASATSATKTITEFETLYPGVLALMDSSGYSYNSSTGIISYSRSGIKTVYEKVPTSLNQTIYAITGGEFTFYYDILNLSEEDFDNARVYIKRDDTDQIVNSEDFRFEWKEITEDSLVMKLYYTGEDMENVGNYTIYIEMEEVDTQKVYFSLYDGEIDFYLTAQVDPHAESSDVLRGEFPPGNSTYEWYLGFFLVQGGKEVTKKNANLITLNIYTHRVDKDEKDNLYYYNQVNYETHIQSYVESTNMVTYLVREGAENDFRTVTQSLTEFKKKYTEAAEMIENKMYNFDSTGKIISDNFELKIQRFYMEDGKDVNTVQFLDASGKQQSLPFTNFRTLYPDMFAYLVTSFVFDQDGYVILGGITDSYRVLEENGKPIEGKEVTDLFEYTVDKSPENVEKAIKILPNPEVDPGTYYVYVTYDNFESIGYVNNSTDAPVSKELYPEMWNQNIHMSSITYAEPQYEVTIDKPIYSNTGNDSRKIYQNIEGSINFGVKYHDIHNFEGLTYKVLYDNNGVSKDVTNQFVMENSLDLPHSDELEDQYITLTTNPELVEQGKYKLVINYTNNGYSSEPAEGEFEIGGKYYGLILEDSKVEFIHNYSETKQILIRSVYVDEPMNIVPSITRMVAGADETYIYDKVNKRFTNSSGEVVFTYEAFIYDDFYEDDPNSVLYEFYLKNVSNVTQEGNYEITFTYQEANNDEAVAVKEFIVGPDEYHFTLSNESAKATDEGMYVTFDIATEHIEQSYLDRFNFKVYMYDFDQKAYIDVSSLYTERRMFEITTDWDTSTNGDYKGKLLLKLLDTIDLSGSFYMEITIEDSFSEVLISDLRSLFNWQITDYSIGSIYEGIGYSGDLETVQLDTLYNNLNNGTISLSLKTVYENDVQWTINKGCVDATNESTCGPGGINYNHAFDDNGNGSGKNKKLVLNLKEDLTDDKKLKPGTYSLILYYSNDNFRFINFDVKSEYAEIEINDPYLYSEISTNSDGTVETSQGLYRNKTGYINMGLSLRGFDYDINQLLVSITNAAGNDVTSEFDINSTNLATDHDLIIKYFKDTLNAGFYTITLSHVTEEEVVYGAYTFEIKDGYFNFNINDPVYSPEKIYPNVEDGGTITFGVKTDGIPNVLYENGSDTVNTQKHVFATNAIITNSKGNDVTDQFTVEAKNNVATAIQSMFDLTLTFEENAIEPGYYKIETHYGLYDYIIVKQQYFEIGDYVKNLNITGTEIITEALDGRLHKNVSSVFRVRYSTLFDLVSDYLTIRVLDEDNNDVTDKFVISNQGTYIDFKYNAEEPYIDSGEYTIEFIYQEDPLIEAFKTNVTMNIYGTYKDILLNNLTQSAEIIYADKENQYYTFDVQSASMTTEDKNNLIIKIYDEKDNIVYSDLGSDNVKNQFSTVNNLNTTEGNMRIDVEAFKARPGDYTVVAYLEDEDGEYNFSNELVITIDYAYYKVSLSNQSYINPVKVYGGNKENVYDRDGADMYFKFTSNYPASQSPVYSIGIYKDLVLYKNIELDATTVDDDGINYYVMEGLSEELDVGEYDFAVCINGLPYSWITKDVKEYVPVTKATVHIGLSSAEDGGTLNVFVGQVSDINVTYEPENATDTEFIFSSADSGIITFNNTKHTATVSAIGNAQVVVKNSDIVVNITAIADLRVASNVYDIDYDNYQIYIKTTSTTTVTRTQFLSNLTGVVSNAVITNRNGVELTNGTDSVGTDWQIQNGNEKYTIILIGDINRDAKITLSDVTMLYQHVRLQLTSGGKKSTITDPESLIAARIRRVNNLSVSDVTKLYQFVRKPGKMSL